MDNFRNRQNAEMRKYNLSLKNRLHNKVPQTVNPKHNRISDTSDPGDSQNFKLRVSDSFYVEDSDEEEKPIKVDVNNKANPKKNTSEVIVISDSSDDDGMPEGRAYNSSRENNNKQNSSRELESIEVSDEDDEVFTGSLTYGQSTGSEGRSKSQSSAHYSSDSTNFELKFENDKESVVDSSYTTPAKKVLSIRGGLTSGASTITSERPANPNDPLTNSSKKFGTPGSTKLSHCTTPLSKKEAKNLMKVIRSKRIESPLVSENNHIIAETDSDSVVTDEDPDGKVSHPAWIDDSDAAASPVPKPSKTHVTRFLNPADNADCLSDEKKKEISRWLLNNCPSERSDDSISNISASNRNSSISSGHRSLERLEMDYETPNNRQKFRDKSNTRVQNPLVNSARGSPRQSLMDDYLKKTKGSKSTSRKYTPIAIKSKTVAVSPAVDTPKPRLDDCADILDKLYGAEWREADVFPVTEPRKKVVLKDRGVQTECIKKPKKLFSHSEHSSNDEGFQNFVRDMRPNLNSTKKLPKKSKYRDSFIVHSSESEESTGDTTYMTALTNPRLSGPRNAERRETPMSLNTIKAIEICDSDTEEDTPVRKNVDNRKKLVFSDDENDHSSETSEYDPDDFVPPKLEVPKTTRPLVNKSKIPTRIFGAPKPDVKREKPKSFLASLSASVPLEECHTDAKRYRLNFKNTKEELVKVLYKIYNEKIFDNKLPPDMLIEWNIRMRGTAGFCYNKKVKTLTGFTRSSRIALATKIVDKPDRLRDTLVHELCHAATWLTNEISDGHGPYWKAWAVKAMKTFPELPPIKRCHDYEIATKFTYRCTQCGYSIGRHSKSLDVQKKRCGYCFGRFELLLNRVTKSGTMKQIPKTPNTKGPSGFALFVKENYSSVKNERHGIAHKEIMQLLGQQFSAIKLSKQNNNDRKSPEESP
ncbi:nucleolar protein dao-5 isoform X2 [Diachasma alloeum]|uniref:nucleolar protein dao-5 isoform X2 n=1 Tax=Diachasma alloeum TaxID=454923 RepID=UPI0007381CDD|nr:nucleolar protein dao-5 isoform X2 [Diachasma alloeum]